MSSTPDRGRIVVVGSLNADLVVQTAAFPKPGETVSGGDLSTGAGGKGANQAVAAGRLGGAVSMVGAVGADAHGELLRSAVAASGVDVSSVAVRDGVATGTALITVDAHGENTIVVSPGANGTLGPADLDDAVLAGASVLGLCLEVPEAVVVDAAERARAAGLAVVLNPSPFHDGARQLLPLVDVLLVNEGEAAALLGVAEDATPGALRDGLAALGVTRAVVTRGADGCVVVDGDSEPVAVPAVRVDAVDTTGAGDAFMGALLLRLADGDALLDAARFAVGVGAFAASRAGAQASYPTPAELTAFLR
ncbi:ribokinase [Leifsonia aquatica]|jgi:ribokinase|uniref:Ribokinase n=2 Tax=Leifsonia aquatica TaxID=144185 RepID=U2RX43_LEIAQ|nr:ribokinase [Leifsonia aquatica]ERK73089.1 putative ribokinase [Leifsonia aquatica ATCC 14665]MBB2967290.1 ribokinase [Leifsonia aquatica]